MPSRLDEILKLKEAIFKAEEKEKCEKSLAIFVRRAWRILKPDRELEWNWHLDILCRFLEAFYRREFRNGTINLPYRLTKSTVVSVCYPPWVWIQQGVPSWQGGPGHQFLTLSHSEENIFRDANDTKKLITSDWFVDKWGESVALQSGSNEKGHYSLTGGGGRISKTAKAGVTGVNADTILYDDPHDIERAQSDLERLQVIRAYDSKVASRQNDQRRGGRMIIGQRAHEGDLTGHVLDLEGYYHPEKNPGGWMQLRLPMRFELDDPSEEQPSNPAGKYGFKDAREKEGELLDPRRFPLEEVEQHEKRLGEQGTAAQFQQRPAPKGGSILKSHYWEIWPDDREFPVMEHTFCSWDTAYSTKDIEVNSYSAMTRWGVFYDAHVQKWAVMMLESWWDRIAYPDLRRMAQEYANDVDCMLIEEKASGQSLVQDLRRARTKVRTTRPGRYDSKEARASVASPILESGRVWIPDRKWARKVIRIVERFPNGVPPCQDLTDTVTQAILYLHKGWWIHHPDDDEIEVIHQRKRERQPAYG
jgi:predicted phage terminase large subunit-like protein